MALLKKEVLDMDDKIVRTAKEVKEEASLEVDAAE